MAKDPQEWLRQADYDIETAEHMFKAGRHFYAVFMCHLALEKALKGVYREKLKDAPPRTHNLVYLLNKTHAKPEESVGRFLVRLNEASVATRYPEELDKLQDDFTEPVVRDILARSREVLKWIKTLF
ncbi:MAG: HEPN domain-containing protein [Candidatus Eisenbacteria bacterium]|nr:HEPN domain-containing protein [Candidatus Eisenbacteria bacterium]